MPKKLCGYLGLDPVVCCPDSETSNINSTRILEAMSAPYVPLLYIPPKSITNNNLKETPTAMEPIAATLSSISDRIEVDNLTETKMPDSILNPPTLPKVDGEMKSNDEQKVHVHAISTANDEPVTPPMLLPRMMPKRDTTKIGSIAFRSKDNNKLGGGVKQTY